MIDYQTFMRHSEKITKNAPETRPVLMGVNHLENGDVVVTDSHRLYLAKAIHDHRDEVVLSPKGKEIKGSYPDVTRLIPDSSYAKQEIEIDLAELIKGADIISHIGGLVESKPAVGLIEDHLFYSSVQLKIKYSLETCFAEPLWVNAHYLYDALKLLKATSCKTVTVRYYGAMRPFTIVNEDESLLALILPIRKY